MAIFTSDLLRGLGQISYRFPLFNLATSGVQTLFTFPALNLGANKNYVICIVADTFTAGATTATTNFGSSAGTQNDYASGASLNPATAPQVIIWPPTTNITYAPSTIFQSNTTGAGSGTCTLSIWTVSL